MNDFKSQLFSGKLTRKNFDSISSLSKIASFSYPDDYVIYDSRAIYSLNWLLFKYSKSKKLFPQPKSRSPVLNRYDLNTVFELSNKEVTYYSYKEAFHKYCKLIKQLSINQEEPYILEMLLFSIAPDWVPEDLKNSVSLTLKCIDNQI
ncbi:MAG: hypothetical protein HWE16_06895 [Gammaproteobacteria bacterium]|nr:hypothetical protein [Gammaproteobacteria bacterium]